MGKDLSRRDLIRRGSTGMTAVGIAGLAGCTGSVPFVGDDYDSAPIGNWLVDPSFEDILDTSQYEGQYEDFELSAVTRSEVGFESAIPEAIFDNADELDDYGQLEGGSVSQVRSRVGTPASEIDDYGQLEGGSVSQVRSRVGTPASEIDWQLSQSITWDWEFTHTQSSFGNQSEATEQQSSSISVDVIGGSFDPDEIEDTLESWADDYLSDEGQYEGHDFYEVGNVAYAVSEETILQIDTDQDVPRLPEPDKDGFDRLELLEVVLDANVDGSDRLTDDDDANELLSRFDQGHVNTAFIFGDNEDEDEPEQADSEEDEADNWNRGLLGGAVGTEIDGQTTDTATVYLFESERRAVADDVEEYVHRNRDIDDEFATLEEYSVEEDGRTVTVTGTVQTQAYF